MKKFRAGFTIIEVVIALTVLSMISLATLSAIRTFGSTQEKLDIVSERTQEMRAVSQFLRRVLVDAQPLMRQQQQVSHSYLRGGQRELVWVAPFSASRVVGGLTVFRLFIDEDQQLSVQFAPYLNANQTVEWDRYDAHVLVSRVDELTLTYNAGPLSDWVAGWENATRNPDRIRISLAVNGRYWPDLIIRLHDSYAQPLSRF